MNPIVSAWETAERKLRAATLRTSIQLGFKWYTASHRYASRKQMKFLKYLPVELNLGMGVPASGFGGAEISDGADGGMKLIIGTGFEGYGWRRLDLSSYYTTISWHRQPELCIMDKGRNEKPEHVAEHISQNAPSGSGGVSVPQEMDRPDENTDSSPSLPSSQKTRRPSPVLHPGGVGLLDGQCPACGEELD